MASPRLRSDRVSGAEPEENNSTRSPVLVAEVKEAEEPLENRPVSPPAQLSARCAIEPEENISTPSPLVILALNPGAEPEENISVPLPICRLLSLATRVVTVGEILCRAVMGKPLGWGQMVPLTLTRTGRYTNEKTQP